MEKLPQEMLKASTYPHEVREPIREITTHISHVYLTGEFAYKIKRPVDYGFLDFHTVDQRKYFCFEELRLNQRLSKDLYIEVVPIFRTPEKGVFLGAEEEKLSPIDWALKMKEFPQSALFSNLITEGELNFLELERLGKKLAQFHKEAATDEEIIHFGNVSKYQEIIDQNEDSTREYIGDLLSKEAHEQIFKYQKEFIGQNQSYFKERQLHENIRECHGDLHLENVVHFQGEPLPFDCIEFNKSYKFIDTFYDIAFLFMDLLKNHRADLAYSFLNSYLENSGDYYGGVLLNFFTSLRASIRGKICAFKMEIDPEGEKEEAKKFFKLANDITKSEAGKIICFCGVSGSGKSTLAKKFSREIGAIHIRSDVVRKHLGGVPLDEKGPQELYSEEMTRRTYDVIMKKALILPRYGQNIILDAKFDQKEVRDDLIRHCEERGLALAWIKCEAPEDILLQRLTERKGDVSDAGAELLKSQIANFENFSGSEKLLELDTSKEQLEKALEFWQVL